MDLGVGSFVFSSGIVSARPFLKRPENRFKPLKGQLFNAVKQSLPILSLGLIRLIMVKGVDYQVIDLFPYLLYLCYFLFFLILII